jgi:hypothetical protein
MVKFGVAFIITPPDENKCLIGKEGGIDLILKTMRRHAEESKLQAKACGALRNIARNNGKLSHSKT